MRRFKLTRCAAQPIDSVCRCHSCTDLPRRARGGRLAEQGVWVCGASADRREPSLPARFGDGAVIVGDVRNERRPPRPGEVTHSVIVRVDDVNAHCAHGSTHGAHILMEPADFEYGERQYTAEDPAGHQWTCSETLDDVPPDAWGGTLVTPGPHSSHRDRRTRSAPGCRCGHPAVSHRSYSMLSRKLSTRCLSSVAALSS
jgi:hypothetical protein